MSERDQVLSLPPPNGIDKLGGYVIQRLESSTGHTLATYQWTPECGMENAAGVAFLLHGVLAHTTFEWLSSDEKNHRVLLKGSMVEHLLSLDLVVIGHDHPGHGRSSGLHAYVDTHDHLRDAAIDVVNHFTSSKESPLYNKRKIMVGMSMGGTTAIRVCDKVPDLIDAYILFSPAVKPPDNMFGWQGHFLRLISPILGLLVPKLPVLALPPSPDPIIRDAVEQDGLVNRDPVRVRMGTEFLRVYSEIDEHANNLRFKSVVIVVGEKDQIVSPKGIQRFVDRIQSNDKHIFQFPQFGHDVYREQGAEVAVEKVMIWLRNWLSK